MSQSFQSQKCGRCGAALSSYAPDGLCAACLLDSAFEEGDASVDPALFAPLFAFKDYELQEEVARGGMGVVYRARQLSLNRTVAIKMILGGHLANAAEMRRFRAEAEIAAQLQHPNIVAIHEVGEHAGQPFFSMDLVEGQNLAQLVRNEPLPSRKAAGYLKTIADAVHYAHSHGVLHRDLKPSNILIDEFDQPRVTDFGLAKMLSCDSQHSRNAVHLTQTGQVLGSPSFIPPEQAAGQKHSIGPASDVYALGAVLYHCLTARPPFVAETMTQTLRMVAEMDPVSPRLLNAGVPRDLETICLKCLEKDMARRYQSAQELSEELTRFLRGESIRARPVGRWESFHRWTRRHPVTALLTGVICLLLIAVATISTVAAARLRRVNQEGTDKLREAYLAQARAYRWSARAGRRYHALDSIRNAAAIHPDLDLRNEAIATMALVDVRTLKTWSDTNGVNWGFDAALTLYARSDGRTVRVCRMDDDADVALVSVPGATNCYYCVLSPDGRYVLAGFKKNGEAPYLLFDVQARRTAIYEPHFQLRSHHFSNDGRYLFVTLHRRNAVVRSILYDLASLQPVSTNALTTLTYGVQFHPQDHKIAVSYSDHPMVEVRDPRSGVIIESLPHDTGVFGVCWSPDGSMLLTGGADYKAYLWHVAGQPRLLRRFQHQGSVVQVAFCPSGDFLLTRAWDSLLRIWDPITGRELLRIPSAGLGAGFSPDGRRLISWDSPHTMSMFEVEDARERRRLRFADPVEVHTRACNFSPDGRVLVSSHPDGIRLWDLAAFKEVALLAGEAVGAMFHPSGTNLIAMFADRRIELWPVSADVKDTETGTTVTQFQIGPPVSVDGSKPFRFGQMDRVGKELLGLDESSIRVFDLNARQFTRNLQMPMRLHRWALDPSGKWALITPNRLDDHHARIYDLTNERLAHVTGMTGFNAGAFTSDGSLLFVGSSEEVRCLETESWKTLYVFQRYITGDSRPLFAFSPDGTMGVCTLSQQALRLFTPQTGQELATWEPPEEEAVESLAFSPDSGTLAVASRGTGIHLWDLRSIRRQLKDLKLDLPLPALPAVTATPNAVVINVIGAASSETDPVALR